MHAIGNYIADNSNRRVLYVTSNDFINDFIKIQRKSQNDNNFDNMDFFKEIEDDAVIFLHFGGYYRKYDELVMENLEV